MYKILDEENSLTAFYDKMSEIILRNDFIVINYKNDKTFSNALKYIEKRIDLPFFSHLRHSHMTNETLKNIQETMNIDKEVLIKIKNAGYTIVRTGKFEKRKTLRAELGKHNIVL